MYTQQAEDFARAWLEWHMGSVNEKKPCKLTWNGNNHPCWKRKSSFQTSITVFHVNFPGFDCFQSKWLLFKWLVILSGGSFKISIRIGPMWVSDRITRFALPICFPDIHFPKYSTYGLFTHIWLSLMVNVGKYTVHWVYGFNLVRTGPFFCKKKPTGRLVASKGPPHCGQVLVAPLRFLKVIVDIVTH